MSFISTLIASQGAGLAEKLGVPSEKVAELLPQLAPMILGAVQQQGGDDDAKVEALLDEHGGENAESDSNADAEGLLGGAGTQKAVEMISSKLGVDEGLAKQYLPKIISFVLGLLNQKKSEAGGGGGMSMVRGFLDKDGDGSMLDDLGGMLGGDSDGGLGGLVGGFMGGKK